MGSKHSQATIAKALADAKRMPDREAAMLNGIGLSTLRRYRAALDDKSPLAAAVEASSRAPEDHWAEGLPKAINSAIDFLMRANQELDPTSHRAVDSVARAMDKLIQADITYQVAIKPRLPGGDVDD